MTEQLLTYPSTNPTLTLTVVISWQSLRYVTREGRALGVQLLRLTNEKNAEEEQDMTDGESLIC